MSNVGSRGVAKARLPLPCAVWDTILVYESRAVLNVTQTRQREGGTGGRGRDEHPIDAVLAEGPVALVVLFSHPPPGVQLATGKVDEFLDCAVLAVPKTNSPSESSIRLVGGHGIRTVEEFKHFASTRSLVAAARGLGLVGFVRLTMGLYVSLVTASEKVGVIGPHVIFNIQSSRLYYLGDVPQGETLPRDELRYQDLFQQFDLSTGYLYCPTLDLTRRLSTCLTIVGLPQRDKYRWNTFLAEPLRSVPGTSHFCICMIRGSVMQTQVYFGLRQVSVVLIARCSKKFAGARYLKRGVNDEGHVANHVEVEQIVIDEDSLSSDRRTGTFSSFVQVRGSVPVFWGHENTLKPKPAITFARIDNSYTATKKHFSELLADFGAPVYVLNLLKQREKHPREQHLNERYRLALGALRQDIPDPDAVIRYVEFDFRNRTHEAWNELTAIAEDVLRVTGFFMCDSQRVHHVQCGVLRSNCVDCVDRTNYGQFFIGLHAFSMQLASLGVVPSPCGIAHLIGLRERLLALYIGLGDNIGRQYGGSSTVSAGLFGRGVGWDKLMGIKRFYINQFEDAERQRATNLFLGLYTPRRGASAPNSYHIPLKMWTPTAPTRIALLANQLRSIFQKEVEAAGDDSDRHIDIWDIDSDYYLHVRDTSLPPVPIYDPAAFSSPRRPRGKVAAIEEHRPTLEDASPCRHAMADSNPQMEAFSTRSWLHSPAAEARDLSTENALFLLGATDREANTRDLSPIDGSSPSMSEVGHWQARASRGVLPDPGVVPFAAHPESRSFCGASAPAELFPPTTPPTCFGITSTTPSLDGHSNVWCAAALNVHQSVIQTMFKQPVTPEEATLCAWHRSRDEHYCGPRLLAALPVYHCADVDFAALHSESEVAMELRLQQPYKGTAVIDDVFPPETNPVEDLQPEDQYDLVIRPAQYLEAYQQCRYVADELSLIEASNRAYTVQPEKPGDAASCASVLRLNRPSDAAWTLDELEDALRSFRPPKETPTLLGVGAMVADLRALLLGVKDPYYNASTVFFEALSQYIFDDQRNENDSTQSMTASQVLMMQQSFDEITVVGGGVVMTNSVTVVSSRTVQSWIASRCAEEKNFLTAFGTFVTHCPSPVNPAVYQALQTAPLSVANEVFPRLKPSSHVMAAYIAKSVTDDELEKVLRGWLVELANPVTGVPRCELVRYAADLEKQCPRAFVFYTAFTGETLVRWILSNAERLGIDLCESRIIERPGEREKAAWTFASNLIAAGIVHSVSFTVAVTDAVGLVMEPTRFRQSVEPHGVYRFLFQEPRVVFRALLTNLHVSTPVLHLSNPDAVVMASFMMSRISLQWLYESGTTGPSNPREIGRDMLQFIEECNLTALSPTMMAVFFINMFNSLFCLVFSHLREPKSYPKCVDFEIAMHTMTIRISRMDYSLADIKHGVLRNNARDSRMALRQFSKDDARVKTSIPNPDPRWLLMLLDISDDHDIEQLASTVAVSGAKTTQALEKDDDSSSGEDLPLAATAVDPLAGDNSTDTSPNFTALNAVPQLVAHSDPLVPLPETAVSNFTVNPESPTHHSWLVRRFFRRDTDGFETLRCVPLHTDELEGRLASTTKHVVSLLTTAYGAGTPSSSPVVGRAPSSALKSYASKIMTMLRSCPELGATRDQVLNTLRNASAVAA